MTVLPLHHKHHWQEMKVSEGVLLCMKLHPYDHLDFQQMVWQISAPVSLSLEHGHILWGLPRDAGLDHSFFELNINNNKIIRLSLSRIRFLYLLKPSDFNNGIPNLPL